MNARVILPVSDAYMGDITSFIELHTEFDVRIKLELFAGPKQPCTPHVVHWLGPQTRSAEMIRAFTPLG